MPLMRGNTQGGAIVVTAGAGAIKPESTLTGYGTSRAGLLQLMRVASQEGKPDGVRVNAVAAGDFPGLPQFDDLVAQAGNETAALDRMAAQSTPIVRYNGEAPRLIARLLTENTRLSGATLVADAGSAF
jgi:NAD(P)-dependent dehydrogenase (short-subunit alcohol dehydrogenase family)